MAYLYKNHLSRYWIAAFYDKDGKRRNRSTKVVATEKNRKKAMRIADEYELAARAKRTSLQVRRVITELHREITGDNLVSLTMREHGDGWHARKRPEVAKGTLNFYHTVLDRFCEFLGSKANAEIHEITREDVTRFRNSLANRLAPRTVNHYIKVLRSIFKDAKRENLIIDDPTEFVDMVKGKKVVNRRPFTMDEVKVVLDYCDDEWRSMVLFGLYTGQRLGDVARLTWEAIDLKKGTITLTTGKTDKRLVLPMAPPLKKHIRSLPHPIVPDQPLHREAAAIVEEQDGKTGHLSNRFAKILADAGLREKKTHKSQGKGRSAKRELNGLSYHSLRRTATTLLHEAGVPAAVAQALIGHDSEEIHAIYINVGESAMREAAKKLPAI